MKSKYKSGRSVFALIVVCLVIFSFAADLFNIQVKNNEYYAAQNNTESKYVVELEAARGEIVDRNGNALVTNKQGNSIILNAVFFPSQKDVFAQEEFFLKRFYHQVQTMYLHSHKG